VVAACALVFAAADGTATGPATLVVDDDRVQCADADFSSIQAAVDEAESGALIRVCPGLYAESVTVDKALTLKGSPDAVEAIDCFDPGLPEPHADEHAIVAPADATQAAFTLGADGIELAGFVVSRAWPSIGIRTSEANSGYRIHHNLITKNRIGIDFRSGSTEASRDVSRFDHNCLRENNWGLTAFGALLNARIDHNASFGTPTTTPIGEAGGYAFQLAPGVIENVTLDHNHSRQDWAGYLIWNSKASRIVDNTLESVTLGITVGNGIADRPVNRDLEISRNVFIGPAEVPSGVGIGFETGVTGLRSTDVLVSENTITRMLRGIAIGGPPGRLTPTLQDSLFTDNVISDSREDGIRLRGGNTGNTFRGNVVNRNGRFGINAECGPIDGTWVCPTRNTFEANQMLENRTRDARDQTRILIPDPSEWNTWIGNKCLTDFPVGTICGIG
jgi:parallel beta-helix repeat protein